MFHYCMVMYVCGRLAQVDLLGRRRVWAPDGNCVWLRSPNVRGCPMRSFSRYLHPQGEVVQSYVMRLRSCLSRIPFYNLVKAAAVLYMQLPMFNVRGNNNTTRGNKLSENVLVVANAVSLR